MIYLNITLILIAVIYIALAFKDKTRQRQPAYFDPRLKTWRRDMTAHEIQVYNEMRKHWQNEAKIIMNKWQKIAKENNKKINYANRNQTR